MSEGLLSSDRREVLVALQKVLAAEIGFPSALTTLSMLTSAARELRAVTAELERLGVPERSVLDDLIVRRASRLAGSDDLASASRRGQSRRSGRSDRAG